MHGRSDERILAGELKDWLDTEVYSSDELAVVIDGDHAALVVFGRGSTEPRHLALNVPVVYPPDGFLGPLIVMYDGQLQGRPPIVA